MPCGEHDDKKTGQFSMAMPGDMKILFNKRGHHRTAEEIRDCVAAFGRGYNRIVCEVIESSRDGLNKDVFRRNVAILMPNFLMTRGGPFKGVNLIHGIVKDPEGQIAACWDVIGERTIRLREFVDEQRRGSRTRGLVELPRTAKEKVAYELRHLLNKLSPVCWTENSFGLVGASKVLFAVLPEIALPIDNAEWKKVFKTIDYRDIITTMADEICQWEKRAKTKLNSCDQYVSLTLPGIYNVMAMKARP